MNWLFLGEPGENLNIFVLKVLQCVFLLSFTLRHKKYRKQSSIILGGGKWCFAVKKYYRLLKIYLRAKSSKEKSILKYSRQDRVHIKTQFTATGIYLSNH